MSTAWVFISQIKYSGHLRLWLWFCLIPQFVSVSSVGESRHNNRNQWLPRTFIYISIIFIKMLILTKLKRWNIFKKPSLSSCHQCNYFWSILTICFVCYFLSQDTSRFLPIFNIFFNFFTRIKSYMTSSVSNALLRCRHLFSYTCTKAFR